jgi:uncharacterized protein YbbC (DUF1343 family)
MIRLGVDRTEIWEPLAEGKRVGLVCSPASVSSAYEDEVTFVGRRCHLVALFGPEHGVRGSDAAGECIGNAIDPYTGLPAYSLYQGEDTHLDPSVAENIDVLIYDIQDLGLRFYTYIATLKGLLRDAASLGLPIIVLDRPNPLGGSVYGAPLDRTSWSFVGPEAIPVRYGMTAGEIARFFNERQEKKADLTVVRMEGWNHGMLWPDTGRVWIPTSPAIGSFASAFCYAGFCFFEGTNLSEGRGTTTPFQLFGSPYLDGQALASYLNGAELPGLRFVPRLFKPDSGKWKGEVCNGVLVIPEVPRKANPVKAALLALWWIGNHHRKFAILPPRTQGALRPLERLMGKEDARRLFSDADVLFEEWEKEGIRFQEIAEGGRMYAE